MRNNRPPQSNHYIDLQKFTHYKHKRQTNNKSYKYNQNLTIHILYHREIQ